MCAGVPTDSNSSSASVVWCASLVRLCTHTACSLSFAARREGREPSHTQRRPHLGAGRRCDAWLKCFALLATHTTTTAYPPSYHTPTQRTTPLRTNEHAHSDCDTHRDAEKKQQGGGAAVCCCWSSRLITTHRYIGCSSAIAQQLAACPAVAKQTCSPPTAAAAVVVATIGGVSLSHPAHAHTSCFEQCCRINRCR